MILRILQFSLPFSAMYVFALPLAGQTTAPMSWEFHVDNDFFNFWQSAPARPDWDYTQGMELSGTWSPNHLLFARFLPLRPACVEAQSVDAPCARIRLAIGQEMYTPEIDSTQLIPGQRPYAGWLYGSFSESVEGRDGLDEVRGTVGLTGRPSLAEAAQETWHRWFGFYDRVGWPGQIPFEPDFSIRWTHARELVPRNSMVAGILHLAPYGVAEIGTLKTALTAGANITAGLNPRPAWQPTGRRGTRGRAAVYLGAGGQIEFVARNLFLDGDTFRSSPYVVKEPFVGQITGLVGVAIGRIRFEWDAVHLTREYATQLVSHTYSRLLARIE